MIPFLGLLKNPLFRLVANKTIGAISHKLKKDEIVKQKELDAASQISIEQIRQQENSFKDEWLVIFFTILIFDSAFAVTAVDIWKNKENQNIFFYYLGKLIL